MRVERFAILDKIPGALTPGLSNLNLAEPGLAVIIHG